MLVQHNINHSDDESQSISENESGNDIQSIISPTQYEKDCNDEMDIKDLLTLKKHFN